MEARTVWKYQLELNHWQTIDIPRDAKILSVHMQEGTPCIWALVNPDNEKVKTEIHMLGTGLPITENIDKTTFLGTVLTYDHKFVWHFFVGQMG